MQMTEGEIRRSYKEAREKKKQIRILAELNACSVAEIQAILDGRKPERPSAKRGPKPKAARVKKAETKEVPETAPAIVFISRRVADELVEHLEELEERRARLIKELNEIQKSVDEAERTYAEFLEYVTAVKVKEEDDGK